MPLTDAIMDALVNHPCDAEALVQRLPAADRRDIDAALAELVAGGVVVAQHLQTLPPRTLYRISEAPASPPDADDAQ